MVFHILKVFSEIFTYRYFDFFKLIVKIAYI